MTHVYHRSNSEMHLA